MQVKLTFVLNEIIERVTCTKAVIFVLANALP